MNFFCIGQLEKFAVFYGGFDLFAFTLFSTQSPSSLSFAGNTFWESETASRRPISQPKRG